MNIMKEGLALQAMMIGKKDEDVNPYEERAAKREYDEELRLDNRQRAKDMNKTL